MTRPFSWFPLAPSDPVPGDPVVVLAASERYVQVAETIDSTARNLRDLTTTDGIVSEAVAAVREKAREVAEDILRAKDRYDGVGRALQGYAAVLDTAQAESEAALRDAQAAQQRVDAATSDIAAAQRRLDGLSADEADDPARTRYRAQLARARNERDDAEAALAAARTRLDAAVTDRDRAAERAIEAIEGGMSGDELDDGWWEDWGSDVAQQVSTWAGRVSGWAGMASLFLGWVPFLGPALTIIAVGAGVLALAADVALTAKRGDGNDWFNVGIGVLGLATFSAGRSLGGAVRQFRGTAQTAIANASARSSRSVFSRIRSFVSRRPQAAPAAAATRTSARTASFVESGGSFQVQFAQAWRQVKGLHGMDRLLALAGHGDLVATNNALRAALWDAFPCRPRAVLTLLGPTLQGTALEVGAGALWVGDAALGVAGQVKDVVGLVTPDPVPAAERLGL